MSIDAPIGAHVGIDAPAAKAKGQGLIKGRIEFARGGLLYLVGGALCAVINNIVLILVDDAGGALITGVLLSWLAGGTIGFLWHSRLTYRSQLSIGSYLRFMAGVLLGVPLAWMILFALTRWIGWDMWIAGPVTTLALFCYNCLNSFAAIRWQAVMTLFRRTR